MFEGPERLRLLPPSKGSSINLQKWKIFLSACTFALGISVALILTVKIENERGLLQLGSDTLGKNPHFDNSVIHVAVVSCGESILEETMTQVKSAIIFTQHTSLQLYYFVDDATMERARLELDKLKEDTFKMNTKFNYTLLPTNFPPLAPGMLPWEKLWKPCATLRVFFPSLLPEVDSLIYFDIDTLILSNLTELWDMFHHMKETAYAGLVRVQETSYPPDLAKRLPYYMLNPGYNDGVVLMNLTRMRQQNFQQKIVEIRQTYDATLPAILRGDQTYLDILFNAHPEYLEPLPCDWNLRIGHCISVKGFPTSPCQSALQKGVGVIHGTADGFINQDGLPLFRHIYNTFKAYDLRRDNLSNLFRRLSQAFDLQNETCSFSKSTRFYKRLDSYIYNLNT